MHRPPLLHSNAENIAHPKAAPSFLLHGPRLSVAWWVHPWQWLPWLQTCLSLDGLAPGYVAMALKENKNWDVDDTSLLKGLRDDLRVSF